MNDPGLDEPINNASSEVKETYEPEKEDGGMDEEEEERSFLVPARWWYAQTAFPLLAGTFGPMASAFSICALVENWRVKIPPGGTEEHGINIKDPRWLIAVNAVSLVCALIANMSLLLNMARRLSFKIAQPVTILGFWFASILLIALIAVAAHDFHEEGVKHQALTQAYYYAIFAAGLYQFISYLMCVTVYGAYTGRYSKQFQLTVAQRTLMLQTIWFLFYLLLGALVYSHIEGWEFLDAVYWADFTLLTIGIGDDYTPATHLGRGLLFPFALGGIIILGLVVGSIRSLVLDRGKKKMGARMTEKTRQRLIKEVAKAGNRKHPKGKPTISLDKDTAQALTLEPGSSSVSEGERRRAEFNAMRTVQSVAAREQKYMSLCTSTFAFAFLWFIGALVFFKAEKNQQWTYFEALYFSYTSLLTIGYGDFQPISNSGKPFFVFWSLLAIPALTILISHMGDTVVKAIKDSTIWVGEVTVLPSDEGSVKERLRYGLFKATLGRVGPGTTTKDEENASSEEDDDEDNYQEMHPGLAHEFRERPDKKKERRQQKAGDRLATEFEDSENLDASLAKKRGDRVAEDEHHYRAILIAQIRKVYDDSTASTPKKYSYREWTYFLRLLGEDENDTSFHRRAPAKAEDPKGDAKIAKDDANAREKAEFDQAGQKVGHDSGQDFSRAGKDSKVVPWSWIGNRSPLMGDKDEAEWLLEQLFQRLDESLRQARKEKGKALKGTTAHGRETERADYNSSPSGHTTLDGEGSRNKSDIGAEESEKS